MLALEVGRTDQGVRLAFPSGASESIGLKAARGLILALENVLSALPDSAVPWAVEDEPSSCFVIDSQVSTTTEQSATFTPFSPHTR